MIFCYWPLYKIVLYILMSCITMGIIGLICRLNDFRLTKNTVQFRLDILEAGGKPNTVLEKKICENRVYTRLLGKLTWGFLYIEIVLFVIAIWILTIGL